MDSLDGPVIILDGADCAVLGRQLVEAIRLGYTRRGGAPPHALLEFADRVNAIARFRATAQASPGHETGRFPVSPSLPSSDQEPVWLTATEAARIAEVSVQLMRMCLRKGHLKGTRGHRSAWRVDAVDLAAWMVSRRRDDDDTKAA